LIRKVASYIKGFIHIQFQDHEIENISIAEQRRIRMVNYIGVIALVYLSTYLSLFAFLDFKLFRPAFLFYIVYIILILGIMFINKIGYHSFAKVSMVLISTLFIVLISTWIFGKTPDFQTFILLIAFIPLFFWPLSKRGYLLVFFALNYSLYILIEYFPPIFNHIIELPENYINLFHSTNVLACFLGAVFALAFFIVLATKKEEKLIKKTHELEESQRHQDLVYSVIAHDLKSPLNGLLGLTDLLQRNLKKYGDEKKEEVIDMIFKSSRNLNNLLENLLEWSKLKSGMHNINLQFFSLERVVNETINLLNDRVQAKNINLKSYVDSNIKVFADTYMISTVIRNLVTNAVKFTPSAGIVKITSKEIDSMLRVCVEDTGVGIPQKYLKNLFKLESTYINIGTNSEKGSGLGLKICGDFIKANDGEIWAESEVNKGSRFYFTMPLNNYLL